MAFRTIEQAKVQSFRVVVGAPEHAFNGGPVLEAESDRRLRHCHNGEPADRFDPSASYAHAPRLAGTWNYLGPVYPHFGHVMAEMIHRVLPSREIFKHDQWLAVTSPTEASTDFWALPASYREALAVLGIGAHNLVVINRDTLVERLNIAEQGTHLGRMPMPSYLDALNAHSTRYLDSKFADIARPRRVYVSRAGIPDSGNFLGESCLEAWLSAEGFEIFKPEQHPLAVQMDVYRKAEVLVFSEGSACHGTELLGAGMLDQVYLLLRRSSHQHIWHDVLKSRSQDYADEVLSIPLGSCVCHPDLPGPLPNFEQFVFDLDALIRWCRALGIADLHQLDKKAYFDRAALDLEQHFDSVRKAGHLLAPPDTLAAMRQALATSREQQLSVSLIPAVPVETDPPVPVAPTVEATASAPMGHDTGPASDESVADLEGLEYRHVLAKLHDRLNPERYLEIGVSSGASLALATGTVIGIDPDLSAMENCFAGKRACLLFQMTSDDFFERHSATELAGGPINLAFLDGLHYFEYLLRDFIHTEKVCARDAMIVLHDCVPTDAGIAERENSPALRPRHPDWWAGDVWKLIPILKHYRPDLRIDVLDAAPTGLVVIRSLDPSSQVLKTHYDEIYAQWHSVTLAGYGLRHFLSQSAIQSADRFDPMA